MNLPPSPRIPRWPACLLLGLGLLLAHTASAKCETTKQLRTAKEHAAPIPFGRVNLTDLTLQPYSSMIASIVVPPTNYTYKGASADTVLWKCDKADLASQELYFLVSTNGNSRFGGHNEIGEPDGLSDVYGIWFKHIGLRLSMDGVVLSRYWRKVPLKPGQYAEVKEGNQDKIHIRLGDLPPMQAELYRVRTETPKQGYPDPISMNCADYARGASAPSPTGTLYNCRYPHAYIQLHGPGLKGDEVNQDHHTAHRFLGANNGFGYTLYNALTLSNTATCTIFSLDRHVRFNPISVQQLQDGESVSNTVDLTVKCDNRDISGIHTNQTAIGLQVSPGAFTAAKRRGLVKDGGVEYLLCDLDGEPGMAKGVGIGLFDSQGQQRRFVGLPGSVDKIDPAWTSKDIIKHAHPKGPDAGWHPVLQDAVVDSSSAGDVYGMRFTFKLMKLPGTQEVTPGQVRATAHVLIKVQ